MNGYGYGGNTSYDDGAGFALRRSAEDLVDFTPDSARGAAVSVAVLLIACTAFLTLMKKSGFRAMVAVGRT